MEDRELLELAAKAAGMNYLIWTPGASPIVPSEHRVNDRSNWHPLADDGDALRLAVTLCITDLKLAVGALVFAEGFQEDKYAMTRRAIVRAAAEIGKGMP